jgi:hypothetical protein
MRGAASKIAAVGEGAAMRIAGWTFGSSQVRLLALPAIAIAGCTTWMMLPGRSDAEGQSANAASPVLHPQNVSLVDRPTRTDTISAGPEQAAAPPDVPAPPAVVPSSEANPAGPSPIDGLKISSQSWRRGGLGSKALLTFTLRNANDYAVKDIEIACAFARRDGSHLTDRRRVIAEPVGMKSRKTYSGMLIGFVNVNANKAKCSAVAASRT